MELYRKARTRLLADVDGKIDGRMLGALGPQQSHPRRLLDTFAGSSLFPWRGQTLEQETAEHGHGGNQLFWERVDWFPFKTSVRPSTSRASDSIHRDHGHDHSPAAPVKG